MPLFPAGRVGGQFWSVYVSCHLEGFEAVQTTLEQIDMVKRMVGLYPDTFAVALSSQDVRTAFAAGKIASLMGAWLYFCSCAHTHTQHKHKPHEHFTRNALSDGVCRHGGWAVHSQLYGDAAGHV